MPPYSTQRLVWTVARGRQRAALRTLKSYSKVYACTKSNEIEFRQVQSMAMESGKKNDTPQKGELVS